MEHTASKVKVYQSSNYNLFKVVAGNRAIDKKKIDRIIKEINEGNDILDEVPILVKEDGKYLKIVEGQHRFEIAKKLARPVQYILKKQELSLYNIAKINSNTEKWSSTDFINCYVTAGNTNYKKLAEFREKYKMGVGVCITLLTHGTMKSDTGADNLKSAFETGLFEVKKLKDATQIAEICKQFEAFGGWNSRAFIVAICKIIEANKCDFAILLKKFNRDPSKLQSQSNWKDIITNLEVIYNFDNSKRRVIF